MVYEAAVRGLDYARTPVARGNEKGAPRLPTITAPFSKGQATSCLNKDEGGTPGVAWVKLLKGLLFPRRPSLAVSVPGVLVCAPTVLL